VLSLPFKAAIVVCMQIDSNVYIQNNIKKQLSLKGMSVRDLERRSGLKYSVVQNILHGRSKNPTIKVIQRIARELDCTIEDLIDNSELNISRSGITTNPELNDIPWNGQLWIDSSIVVQKILAEKELTPSKEKAILCIQEVYNYSFGTSDKADSRFATWVIEKFLP